MADWYGTMRSNYFRVQDRDAFDAWIKRFPDLVRITKAAETDVDTDSFVGFYATDASGYGSVPDARRCDIDTMTDAEYEAWVADGEPDEEEVDFYAELASHLSPGSCAVIMAAGAEKVRYVTGVAVAVTSKGIMETVSLSDIYDLVAKRSEEIGFPIECTPAEY